MHGDSGMLPHLDTKGFPSSKPELETPGYGDDFGFYACVIEHGKVEVYLIEI